MLSWPKGVVPSCPGWEAGTPGQGYPMPGTRVPPDWDWPLSQTGVPPGLGTPGRDMAPVTVVPPERTWDQ